jgi:ParB family chromosome partitioning protein
MSMDPLRQGEYFQCDIHLIRPNRYQPRLVFPDAEIAELSRSVKEQGIIQPLLVRRSGEGYELVAGERRLRAAKMAGLTRVPVILKDFSDSDMLSLSVVENVRRKNLSAVEISEACHRLVTEFLMTQEQVAGCVGKSRSSVANFLRLRRLPEAIKKSITDGELSMGHARALLGAETAEQQTEAWQTVLSKNLSVRETEELIRRLKTEEKNRTEIPGSEAFYFLNLAEELSRQLGTRVRIRRRGEKGKLEIEFYNNDDLDRLIRILNRDGS